jgi:DsbC/DsbD-like thiol-disulfide interchange protein
MKSVFASFRATWAAALITSALSLAGCVRTEAPADMASPFGQTVDAPVDVPDPTPDQPFRAAATLTPKSVPIGGEATLIVRARTAPGWHVYAAETQPPYKPARVELKLPEMMESLGEWKLPASTPWKDALGDAHVVYEGDFEFRHELRVRADAPTGVQKITCEITYQACNDQSCLPESTLPLEVELTVE